jgi:GNAT superfamily N-acetyltransferase
MPELRLTRARDVGHFEELALPFLAAREAEHNLIFGIAAGIRSGEYRETPYFAVAHAGERVVGVVIRTPPFGLVLSMVDDPTAIPLFVEDALRRWPDLPGVLGPKEHASAFAAQWNARTGHRATLWTAERAFRLSRIEPARPVSGRPRRAETGDRTVIVEWLVAFAAEALRRVQGPAEAGIAADRAIAAAGGRSMFLWDDGGPVSMTGVAAVTPHGSRVGPVYTPPELRGRGYASALVAAASQLQLDGGRRYCFLFTDLANPSSNKIYQAIGYEPVCDFDEYRFEGPAAADTRKGLPRPRC